MDHVSDASSIEPKLEISADTAIQEPLKPLSPKLLSPIAEKEPIAEDIVTVLQIDDRGHVIQHQSALQTISVVCWSRVGYKGVYAILQPRTTNSLQALQLLAAVAHASETVIPVHAIEDKGMNFQMQGSNDHVLAPCCTISKQLLYEKQIKFQLLRQNKTGFSFLSTYVF